MMMDFEFDLAEINGKKIRCSLSNFTLGSMRNVWKDGKNQIREKYLSKKYPDKTVVNIELIHSQNIVVVRTKEDALQIEKTETKADGIITDNSKLLPVVTAADCMPIYIAAPSTNGVVFGCLHSGWKGTGIASKAIDILTDQFGAKKSEIKVALGPHIRDCCYLVDGERAEYFRTTFSKDCVHPACVRASDENNFALSLEKANLALLEKCGIPKENITSFEFCTCCSKNKDASPLFGSFRREKLIEGKESFSAMAATISLL
ncbi:MAG: polyphenol oxidase family protein [Treponemataceae bacterium]|nr:polyphenol oxidase family protein [Treponemataceae bacterium]